MNSQSKQLIRLFFVGIITCLFIASFSHSPIQTTYAQSASIDELRARVTEIGAYQFTADVEQTLIPRPVPSMIGKTNERLDMRIDGDVTLPDEAYLQIRLEGAGLNVPPLGIEQNGSDAFLLKDGERIQVENPAGLASPTADYLSYLAAAENLQQINPETVPAPEGFTRYVFDINGRQYAAYLQKQLQDNQPNDTPPQTSISISPALQKMNGRGELWLDANGLPRRQIIDLDIPALTSEYDARTHMVVDFAFGDTAATPLPDQLAPQSVETTADTPVPTTPQSPIPNLQSPISPTDFVIDIVLLLAASLLAAALIVGRRRRNLYTGVAISVVFIMVASPLFQVMGLSHFYSQQTHAQTLPTVPEALGVAPAEKTEMTQETRPFTKVSTPGTAATTATQCGTGDASLDSDNDGLDDFSETCLGTDPYYADTDRDLITDTLEIGGFQFNNLTWYSDPLQADSNQDGLADLFEWPAPIGAAPEWDPDNDNIPNLWDEDNDGDGVADNLDLSPFSVSVYSDTFAISTQRGDTYDGYQYIQVQFQPEDETHLRFSTNALDWPYDEEGQITDLDDSTDDLSLIPMLRITTNQEPDPSLASDYGITVLDNDDGTFDLYVPATYMGDGGKITAMEAKVAYESAALDAIEWQDIRFIWVAQMTIDQMVSGSGMSSETTPIHIYEEDSFRLTGWLVTKSSDFENAVLATPNTPEDDRTLFNLLFGLSSTFLSNQTPDIQTIGSRFSNPNTDPVLTWGVPAADVAISYTNTPLEHTDAGWLDLIARTGNLLTANGYATDGRMASVIIAMEQVSGSASMDDVTYTNGNNFDINLSGISLNTQRTLMLDTLTYTSDGWASMTEDEMLTAVINRYPDLTTILADLHLNYPDLSDVDLYEMLALFYASWSVGQSRTLSIDGVQTADDNTPDLEVYNAIYHPTETDLPGYLIEAANIGDSGSGLVIGNDLFSTWSYISEEEGDFVPPAFLSSIFALGQLTFNTDSNSVVITAGTRVAFAGAAIINIAFATYQIGSFLLKSGTSWANWFPRTAGGIGFSVVTTVISLAMIWISFAFTTDFSNQFAVREALVYAIVATIMVIAIAIISYTVVGSILVAIFYITDIILYFATDGDVQLYNTVIQSISDFFYSADQLVDLTGADFTGISTSFSTEDVGIQPGSRVLIEDSFTGTIEALKGSRSLLYDAFAASEVSGSMSGDSSFGTNTPKNGSSSCTETGGFTKEEGDVMTCTNDVGVEFAFTSPHRNVPITLTYSVDAAIGYEECVLGGVIYNLACWVDTLDVDLPEDLDANQQWTPSTIYFDVLPSSVGGLWTWDELTNPDVDSDNLTDAEETALGTISDDWDSDDDDLSDGFEASIGSNPLLADTDGDGLDDGFEYWLETDLTNGDTDGDGLSDDLEVFHQTGGVWSGGGWWVTVPTTGQSYWMFTTPTDADVDGDGLSDYAELANGTSPYAYNAAPQLSIAASPSATSPEGITAVYVQPGDQLSATLSLTNSGITPISDTLTLCLPNALSNIQGGAITGSRTPATQVNGNCLAWDFTHSLTLQPFESVSATIQANVVISGVSGYISATLPYDLFTPGGALTAVSPIIVDNDNPDLHFSAPADGELIGGGVTDYVVGGTASDATSWVDVVTVDLPGSGTVTAVGSNEWAATWNLPVDGVYTLQARAADYLGHLSADDAVQVTIDNTAPTVSISVNDGDTIQGSGSAAITIPLDGTAADNLSGLTRIQISLDDGPWQTVWNQPGFPTAVNWNTTWQLNSGESVHGEHLVAVRAFDQAGNISSPLERTIIIDLLPPTDQLTSRTFLSDPPHYQNGATIGLHGVANDAGNLPIAPNPQDLNGTLHSISEATIWLQPAWIDENDAGVSVTWLGDFNSDRMADLAVGLPAAADGAGKVVIVYGRAGDWPVPENSEALNNSNTSFIGETGAGLGSELAPAGDVNGDGFDDLMIGDASNGRVFLIFGSSNSLGQQRMLDGPIPAAWVELTAATGSGLGSQMAAAGDVNGDGYGDILVGANNQAYLLLGEAIPVWSQVDLDKYAAAIITANAAAITLAGVGDVDDDQLADFAIGDGNSVYLFTGQTSFSAHSAAALTLTDAAATFSSSNNPPAIVGLGDVSGDSLADFVYQSGSSPQIVLGSASQNWTTQSIPAFSPAPDGFLTAAGDVDRDGRHDLLVGNANGDAYLIVGNDLNNVAATFTGVDTAASSLYAAGADLNSDGASDVLLVPSASAAAGLGLNGLMNTPHIRQEWLSVSGTAGETNGRTFSPLAVGASDIYVDDDYCAACANDGYTWGVTAFADVQTAVNAASPGNTIGLQPGVYSSFTVSADNLTIGSTTLADTVFIDGGGGTYGVYINNADGVQLTDLTIRNAQYGVQLEDAGTDGWQTAADKIILDHLFIYDVTSNPIYMNLQSSLSLQQSTLVGSNNHIGTYGNPATISPDPAWSTESSNSNAATDSNSGLVALGNDLLVLGSNDSNNISVYDTSGNSWSSISNGLSGIADGLSVKSAFTTENGEIWALDATDFNGGLPDRAWSLAYVSANEIYVGGDFNNVGGNADIDNIAKWDGTDWTVVGARSDSNYPSNTIIDMDIDSSGRVYVVGSFGLRRFNGSTWEDLGDACFNCPATNQGWMEAIAIYGNDVYVGGKFNGVVSGGATVDANSIARWNNGTWYMVGGSTSGCNGLTGYVGSQEQVTELAIFGSFLYVGGNFYGVYNGSCGSALNADSIARYYLPTSQFMTMQVSGYSGGDGGLYGSSYRSPETFLVIGNKLYVGGEFSTVDWGDGVQHNTANFVSYGLSGTNLTVGETFDGVFSSGVYALAGNSASQIWVGSSSTQLDELNDNNNNVTAHPLSSGFGSAVKLTLASSGILYGAGNISRGHISQYFFSYANGEFSGARLFRGNYTGSAVNWTQESLPAYGFFDMVVYPGAAVTGDGNGNLYTLFGNSNNSLRVYDTNTDSWTSQASLSGIDDGAALVWANNALYAFKGGSSTDFCRWTSNSWNCNIADSPYAISSGSAMSWDGRYYIYATPGGNGRQFMRYNIPYNTWEILGDGNSATPTDDDVPTAVNAGGSTALIGNELYAVPGNDVGSLYRYDPVGIYQERLTVDDVAIVVPNSSSSASWTDATIQETFDISTDNATLVGGSSTNWSPDWSSYGIDTTNTDHTNAAFLDSSLDLYRLTAGSVITAGYHTYRSDALVGTSGQEFSSIQQALNSGANQITVMPGVYQEAVALPSGVALVGAGANRTIITPPDNNPPASLVRAEGVVGSEFGRFTVAGGGALDGIIVEDGSSDVTISRNILRDNINGLLLDDSATDAELVNLTVVGNENGITAVNCAPLDIRNIIIAYNSSTGLQFDGSGTCPGSTYLHNYNLYWANGTDMNPLTPGTAEEFLDPLFTDSADQDYRVKDESPIIDAGDPADPTPPGTGNRVDVGYLEQGSAAFYADDDYCDLCANDGLTWGVDAFDVIQDALDAAAADLAALATDDVQYSVGVGAGNYNESVTVSSYIQLVGHSAEDTFILGNGGPGVTFDGVVQAGVSSFDITGQGTPTTSVTITGGANSISITGNILSGSRGIWLGGRSTADISFNTIVSGTTAVYATDASTWANVENNILSNNASGLETDGIAQLFSDYNLLFNNTDYTNVTPGDNDLTGQNPLFETGSLRLQAASPAVDTASPLAIVPTGGGERADMGYRELAATPITLFLGDDGVSTAVAYIGVEDVEYGIVPVTVPTSTVTATIPLTWTAVTLNNPGAALSYWNLDYTPANEQLHRLYTRANDSVNNQESDNTVWYAGAFVVDDTAPQISLLYPPEGGSASGISPVELRAEVSDYAAAEFSVEEIYFEIDGQTVTAAWAAEPWTDDGQSARVFRIWTTLSNGSHTIRAIAEDKAGNISSSASGTFIVTGSSSADTTAPTLAVTSPLDGDFVQQTAVFSGTVSDSGSSVASVEVSVDGGVSWEAAAVNGSNWSLTISFPADSEFVSYPAQVRAADKAGNNTIVYRIITIDNLPPTGLQPVTFSSDPGTYFSGPTTLTVTWNTPVDGSGVANVLLDSDTLSDTVPSSGVSGNSAVINLNANDDWYVHIGAVDAADNLNFYNFGPWYVGAGINIDGYLDLAHNEWRSNERLDENENCLSNGLFDTQTLYTTWDNNAVYLGWQNAWWDLDGTMWAYLDTAVGGSSTAMNGDPLPFAADYAMMVTGTDAAEGLLWAYNGTNWTSSALTFAQGQTGDTEAKLPITVSGIATLRLLAFAEDDANTAWTVFPTTNYPQPTWPDYYEWIDPSTIGNVNAGQPQAPCINMSLTSPQPTHVTQGPNDSLSYIMTLPNAESDLVSGLEIALTTDSHLTLQSVTGATCSANCGSGQNWILSVPDLAPTATHFITLTGQLAADLTSITAVTGTADLSWNNTFVHAGSFSHHIDGDKPVVDIYIPPGFAIAGGSQQIYGWADDGPGSGIAQVEIRQDGTDPWLTATGSNLWSATITPPTQSSTWQIEARATDWQGHVSDVVTVNFFVDSVPPVITPTIPLSVKGTYASLTGLAFDPYPVNSLVTAVTVQLDSSAANWNAANVYTPKTDGSQSWAYAWQLPQEDGITHTLRISATDQVGNFTFTNWQDVVVDTVPPVLTATQQITQVLINNNNPILSGSVTDGYGVAQLTAWVYLPDGTAVQESITFAGTSWDYIPTIPISGTYSLWVIAQDLAGNQTVVGDFSLIVYDLGGVSIADVIVDELSPTAVFTVTLHPTSIEDVIIDYTTADGTAVGSSDYTPISGTLTITAGQNSGFIVVPLLDDAVDEAAETFTVTLISLQNSSLSDGQGIGTIVDDDHTPISLGDVYTATEDIPLNVTLPTLLDNDIDQDGDPITATLDSQPLSGTLVLNAAGTFVYTPTLNFYGIDSFTYRATDGFNYSPPVTVTLNVTPVNDPPIAVDDTVFTYAGVAVTTDVLANDINVDGNLDTFFVESISQPVSGTAQINLDATVTYSPAAEFDGQDYFRYVVSDGVYTDTAVITITVAQNIIFLPVIQNTNAIMTAPDLIVEDIQVTADNVQITITNVGNGDVTSAFWIDLYINPNPAPTAVNQLWNYLGTEGLVWGVIDVSSLTAGGSLVLDMKHPSYRPGNSQFNGFFSVGMEIYVQVDSAAADTDYGGVLESHEIQGDPYNNISHLTVSTLQTLPTSNQTPTSSASDEAVMVHLPLRP